MQGKVRTYQQHHNTSTQCMTMSSCSRKCSSNVLHPPGGGMQWTTASRSRTTGTNLLFLMLLQLLVIAVSVTAADRYDLPPALALADATDAGSGSTLSLKEGSRWISNDVSPSLWTSSILPVSSKSIPLPAPKPKHRFSKPSDAAVVPLGKVRKGSKKQRQTAAVITAVDLSSQQVPELQVGCADGFIRSDHHHRRSGFNKKWERRSRFRRDANPVEGERKRRGYYQWTSKTVVPHTPSQTAYSNWQPSIQINRPYFIPMWGGAGRNPVFFPPQPLNPPFPLDNPRTSYLPPMPYLPPYPPRREDSDNGGITTTTLKPIWPGEDTMDMGDDEDGDDEDMVNPDDIEGGGNRFDGPVWGTSDTSNAGNRPSSDVRPNAGTRPNVVPTRRPKISGMTTETPSILHGSSSINQSGNQQNGFNNNIPQISNPIGSPLRPNQIGGDNNRPTIQQPQFTRPPPPPRTTTTTTSTTRRPTTSTNTDDVPNGPSRCVWAIVSCCTATNGQVNIDCFEEIGCEGSFWDTNPCDGEFARAAIANALKYYG